MMPISWVTRYRIPALFVLFTAIALHTPCVARDQVPWVEDLAQAQAEAAAKKQLILLHFWDASCPPCKRVEKNVFSQATFAHQLTQKYVPVKVKVSQNPDLARRFHIDAWPTDVIITPTGEEVYRTVSPQEANNYLSMLNQVVWRYETRPPGASAQYASSSGLPAMHSSAGKPPTSDFAASTAMLMPQASTNSTTNLGTIPAPEPTATNVNHSMGLASAEENVPGAAGEATFPEAAASAVGATDRYASGYESSDMSETPVEPNPKMVDNPFVASSRTEQQTQAVAQNTMMNNIAPVPGPALPATPPLPAATTLNNVVTPMPTPAPAGSAKPDFTMSLTAPATTASTASETARMARSNEQEPTSASKNSSRDASAVHRRPGYHTPPAAADYSAVAQSRPIPTPPKSTAAPTPPKSTTLGLDGYCPVALVDNGRWVAGDKKWGAHHRGRTYLFQSAEAQQKFLASPDRYSPGLAGFDPVVFAEQGEYREGQRTHGIMYHNQIFMFVDEASLSRFWSAPDRYAGLIHQAMGTRESQFR